MKVAHSLALAASLALLLAVPVNGADTVTRDPVAASYARDNGVSVATAQTRLRLQNELGKLNEALGEAFPKSFAGMVLKHQPVLSAEVLFAREVPPRWIELVAPDVKAVVQVSIVEKSLSELTNVATRIAEAHSAPLDVMVDAGRNRVVIAVTHAADVPSEFASSPDVDVEVGELASPTANIYAGLYPPGCGTTGFTVRDAGGVTGITTAGHCGSQVTYQGVSLPFQDEAFGGAFDVQWHWTPGFTDQPWANDGDAEVRYITSVIPKNSQPINSYYCKYGTITHFGCGYVTSTILAPGYVPNAAPTFHRLHNSSGLDLSQSGDSGGPVYTQNGAVGIISGSIGNDLIYMPANYIQSGLGVSVILAS